MSYPQIEGPGRGRQTVALTLPSFRTVRGCRRFGENLPDTAKRLAGKVVYGIEPDKALGIYVGWMDYGDTFARVELRLAGAGWHMHLDGNIPVIEATLARQKAHRRAQALKAKRSEVGYQNANNYWSGRYRKPAWN